uniref:RNA polymerase II assembly factor Rtp1 C-terminal domain-containing protein n=1 Tax=Plectus sambesii TaxID=2011161 RepID=A0A914W6U9_9BILA
MNLPECFELLKIATSPGDNQQNTPSTDPFECLCKRLDVAVSCNAELVEILDTLPELEDTIPGRYVRLLTACLKKMAGLLEPQPADFLISVQQRTLITASLEFLIAIGLLPCLDPGVGVPLEKRSSLVKSWSRIADETKRIGQLRLVVNCLMQMIACNETIKSIILIKFLGDLIAADEQLKALKSGEFEDRFEKIYEDVFRPNLIRELIMLVSGRGGTPPPPWLRAICGGRLSKLLVEQNGLHYLTQAVDDFGGADFWSDWRKVESIARIVSSRPKSFSGTGREYFTNISHQVVSLLDVNAEKFGPFCALVVLKTHQVVPQVINVEVFDRVLHPIELLLVSVNYESFDGTDLGPAIRRCARLLILPPGQTIPIAKRLIRLVPVLLAIYADVQQSISPLKSDLKELLASIVYRSGTEPDRQAVVLIDALLDTTVDAHKFTLSEEEKLTITQGVPSSLVHEEVVSEAFEAKTNALLSVLESFPTDGRGEVIAKMMYRSLSAIKVDDVTTMTSSDATHWEDRMKQMMLLSMLLERFQDQFLANWTDMLGVVKEVLEAAQARSENIEFADDSNERTIELALAILSASLLSAEVADREKFAVFVPLLCTLQSHPKASINESAKSLLQLFTDYLDIDPGLIQKGVTLDSATSSRKSKQHACMAEVVRDLGDPLEAVKGHALIEIGRRVRRRDPEFLDHFEQLQSAVLVKVSDVHGPARARPGPKSQLRAGPGPGRKINLGPEPGRKICFERKEGSIYQCPTLIA